jgi:hypothetical protein
MLYDILYLWVGIIVVGRLYSDGHRRIRSYVRACGVSLIHYPFTFH